VKFDILKFEIFPIFAVYWTSAFSVKFGKEEGTEGADTTVKVVNEVTEYNSTWVVSLYVPGHHRAT